tara:strand:- start:5491 stop:5742 length:252 start_codon:yes stop_codon:yes gene_type:complete
MRQIHAYLNPRNEQGVEDMRITHLLKTLDIIENEVRIYIQGEDFQKAAIEPHVVPFITLNGKKKSFDNAWEEILGEKLHDTDL